MSSLNSSPDTPRIVTKREIEAITSDPNFDDRLIAAIAHGFRIWSKGGFQSAPIQTLGAYPLAPFRVIQNMANTDSYSAQTCVKSGYMVNGDYYVIKVASGGFPFPNSGCMQLYSQDTGKLAAILMDDGILTELRTAAVGALAAKLLAPQQIRCIGILGTGIQARYQLRYLKHVTDCRRVLVYGRTPAHVEAFLSECSQEGWFIQAVECADQLLQRCQLIVTTTSAREPLLGSTYNMSQEGDVDSKQTLPIHINCIGSDAPGKMELHPNLIQACDLLVADSRVQTEQRGEFQHALRQGIIQLEDIVELGEWIGDEQGQVETSITRDHILSIFDSSGMAVQDCVVATMVLDALLQSSLLEENRIEG